MRVPAALSSLCCAVELCSDDGDVVGVDESVAVDVARADILEVGIATPQAGVVHVGREVVLVDASVAVDVALEYAFSSRNLEHVEFFARPEAAYSLSDVQAHVACCFAVEGNLLQFAVATPFERLRLCPVLAVFGERERAV